MAPQICRNPLSAANPLSNVDYVMHLPYFRNNVLSKLRKAGFR